MIGMTPTSTAPGLSGEDLSDLKRYVLEASRKLLVENVDAPRFLPYFRSRFILDQRECDQIKSCSLQSRYDGAEKLLDALLTKGALGYDHFCAAIMHDRTQMFLLTALNKRLEILRDWRRQQAEKDQQNTRAQLEMQRRHQLVQYNRQQLVTNHTHPMMAANAMRYQQASRVPTYVQQQQLHLNITHQAPNTSDGRLARSPIPTEVEPMAASGQLPSQQVPYYHQLPHDVPHHTYQHAQPVMHPSQPVQPETQLAQPDLQPSHPAQPVAQHPYQVMAQHAYPTHAYTYNYPLPSHCVPPPAPVDVDYPTAIENGPYHEHFAVHCNVLTANIPFGSEANIDNLLPGMPPSPSSYVRGNLPHQNYHGIARQSDLPQAGTRPREGQEDIPKGEGGN